jgi:hypothetical protein
MKSGLQKMPAINPGDLSFGAFFFRNPQRADLQARKEEIYENY